MSTTRPIGSPPPGANYSGGSNPLYDSLERRVSALEQGQRGLLPAVSRVNTTVQHLQAALDRFEAGITDVSDRLAAILSTLNSIEHRIDDLEEARQTAQATLARRRRAINKILVGVAITVIGTLATAVVTAINMHVR